MSRRVLKVRSRSRDEIAQIAERVLSRFDPQHLDNPKSLDVVELLDQLQDKRLLEYHLVEEIDSHTEALTLPGGLIEIPESGFRKAISGDGRSRMTIAHEIGHAIMHREELDHASKHYKVVPLYRTDEIPAYCNPEWQAFEFAKQLLIPSRTFKLVYGSRIRRGLDRDAIIERIASVFGVSRSAAEVREQVAIKQRIII